MGDEVDMVVCSCLIVGVETQGMLCKVVEVVGTEEVAEVTVVAADMVSLSRPAKTIFDTIQSFQGNRDGGQGNYGGGGGKGSYK